MTKHFTKQNKNSTSPEIGRKRTCRSVALLHPYEDMTNSNPHIPAQFHMKVITRINAQAQARCAQFFKPTADFIIEHACYNQI
jgi:hypothetical protein